MGGRSILTGAIKRFNRILSRSYPVPWCVPQWGWREFAGTLRCALGGGLVRGRFVDDFASAVRERLSGGYAIPVNRGRTAVELALRGMGIGPGDEVVLPSYMCESVLEAVRRVDAKPAFADVGPDLQMNRETVEVAVTSRTRCVIVAHLFGNAAPIDEIEEYVASRGIAMIDDAAQSFGARRCGRPVGTFGDCGIVSCGPGKPLAGAAGGALVTNQGELHKRAASFSLPSESRLDTLKRLMSFWMERRLRKFTLPLLVVRDRWRGGGEAPHLPCRMSNLDAAIALTQLRRLDETAALRRQNARVMLDALGPLAKCNITDLSTAGSAVKVVLVLPPRGPDVSAVMRALRSGGIEPQRGHRPLHFDTPELRGTLPVTESLWDRVVCIPTQTPLKNVARLAQAIRSIPHEHKA
jgi:perosamine synthetase